MTAVYGVHNTVLRTRPWRLQRVVVHCSVRVEVCVPAGGVEQKERFLAANNVE